MTFYLAMISRKGRGKDDGEEGRRTEKEEKRPGCEGRGEKNENGGERILRKWRGRGSRGNTGLMAASRPPAPPLTTCRRCNYLIQTDHQEGVNTLEKTTTTSSKERKIERK